MVAYLVMLPVISIGPFSISSFGVFLAAGFLFGVFLVWRLARAWDINEERVLDLTLLTFFGGLIGARIYFILENFEYFGWNLIKWISIHKTVGFSFWGALFGGFLTLKYYSKKFRVNFWQALDFAAVGLLGGLVFESVGCLFGGCNVGVTSNLFFAINMVGAKGLRFPTQAVEAALYLFALLRTWKTATHFHMHGTVLASALIYLGTIMLITEPLREKHYVLSIFFTGSLLVLGTNVFYKITKRKIISDIKALGIFLINLIQDPSFQKMLIARLKKSWYNYKVSIKWKARILLKTLRRINVYFSHKDSKYY